jgi:hypothetical protein
VLEDAENDVIQNIKTLKRENIPFTNILVFAQAYPNLVQLKESEEKLSIVFSPIKSISQALKTLSQITNLQ